MQEFLWIKESRNLIHNWTIIAINPILEEFNAF